MTIQALFEEPQTVESLEANIRRAETTADIVQTMLGPFGRIKLLVDEIGRTHLAWTGHDVYDNVEFTHPIADIITEVAESQWEQHGDGSTMSVVMTGELLAEASTLLESGIHPTTICEGYLEATSIAQQTMVDHAVSVDSSDTTVIGAVVRSTLSGSGIDDYERLVTTLTDVIAEIAANGHHPTERVHIESAVGPPVERTAVVEGTAIYQKPGHVDMPERVENATVALIDTPFDADSLSRTSNRTVSDFESRQVFHKHKREQIEALARDVVETGADVVMCNGAIEDIAYNYLTAHGVFSLRHTDSNDMNRVAAATGAKRVSDINELGPDTLGSATVVEQDVVGSKDLTIVHTADGASGVTVLSTATTERLSDRVESALWSGVRNASTALEDGVVPGAGSIEMRMAAKVRSHGRSVSGREQLAVEAFANALEVIPRTLARNAGQDTIDSLVRLREAHYGHEMAGVTTPDGEVETVDVSRICEPVLMKEDAVNRAVEAAVQILRTNKLIHLK